MDENQITLSLIDFQFTFSKEFKLLKNKFQDQQFYKTKYLIAKERKYNFIPIEFVHDKEFISRHLTYVNKTNLSPKLGKDRNFILECVRKAYSPKLFLSLLKIEIDKKFALELVRSNPMVFLELEDKLKNDKDIAIETVKKKGSLLEYMNDNFKDDIDIVISAVKVISHYSALKFASKRLRNEKKVVIYSVETFGMSLMYASKRLRNDRKVVQKAVHQHGCALQYASETLRNDRELVLEAIRNDSSSLYYASEMLKDDFIIVKQAVDQNLKVLSYASERLRNKEFSHLSNDRNLLLDMIKRDSYVIGCASSSLRKDKQFAVEAVKLGANMIFYDLLPDPELLFLALKNGDSGALIINKSDHCFTNNFMERVLEEVISLNPSSLEYLPSSVLNKQFALKALRINGLFFFYLPANMKTDEELIQAAMNQNVNSIRSIPLTNRKDLFLRAVKEDGLLISHANRDLKKDFDLISTAVKQNGFALNYIDLNIIERDKVMILERESVKQCGYFQNYSDDLYKLRMESCYSDCYLGLLTNSAGRN